MKKRLLLIFTILTILALSAVAYADEPADWAKAEVELAVSQNLVPENLLSNYEQAITREEFCVLAMRLLTTYYHMNIEELVAWKAGEMPAVDTFVDTKNPAILAAKALGITNGTDATHFSPNKVLTREMAAAFLAKTAKVTTYYMEKPEPNYADLSTVATWAKSYLGYLYEFNIMKGTADNQFQPKASYQRQQAILTMYRLYNAVGDLQSADVGSDVEDEGVDVSFEQLQKELSYMPYPKDYKAVYTGIYNYVDGTESVKKVVYHKFYQDDQYTVREENYLNDMLAWIHIFYPNAYETYMRMYRNAEYGETLEGNLLETRAIDPDYLEEIKTIADKEFTLKYKEEAGKKYLTIYAADNINVQQYKFDMATGIIVEYKIASGNKIDEFWTEEWKLESFEENYQIDLDLLDSEKVE